MEKFMFGDQGDELVDKVLKGTKIATCSLYDGNIPQENERQIVMNSKEQDICMIEIYDYKIVKYSEITNDMAVAEGERDLNEWQDIHKRYFSSVLGVDEDKFKEDTLLIYYYFRLVEKYG